MTSFALEALQLGKHSIQLTAKFTLHIFDLVLKFLKLRLIRRRCFSKSTHYLAVFGNELLSIIVGI